VGLGTTAWVKARGEIDRGAGIKTGSAEAISLRATKPVKNKKITRFERSLENLLVKSDSLPKIFEIFLAVLKTTATDLKIAFFYLDSYIHC
jgi:hypothetical protein